MTISTEDYALLSQDAYNTHTKGNVVTLGGVHYKVLDEVHNHATGYQGTAYARIDTGEVVIAHCGTDGARMPVQDIGTDAGMVLTGVNIQTADAMAFTKHAMELGKDFDSQWHLPFQATVTGHSLGGTLAEITAYKYDLHGETFNAYGAAGLFQDIPKGGDQVIDNVRATDVVSAASTHFGQVRTYASPQDIDILQKAGYTNSSGFHLADPFKGVDLDAHGIDNFTPNNPRLGHSIISPENAALYQENKVMIDRYRGDVMAARTVISADWEIPKVAADGAIAAAHYVGEKTAEGAQIVDRAAHEAYDTAKRDVHQGIEVTERAGRELAHETVQAYDTTRDKVVQGVHAGEHAVEQAAQHVARDVNQGIQATERVGREVAHEATQAYDATRDKIVHGVHAGEHAVEHAAQHVAQDVEQGYQKLSQDGRDALNRIEHMLDSASKGDQNAFRQGTQAFAAMPAGQEMHTQAVAAVNHQEQQAQQAQQQATQQQTAQQAAQPQQSPGFTR